MARCNCGGVISLETNWPDEDERATRADDAPLVLLVAARLAIGLVADFIGRNLETLSETVMLATLPQPSNVRHSCLVRVRQLNGSCSN